MRALAVLLLFSCTTPAPQIIQVVPEMTPVCGFTRPWMHCCVLPDGPNLIVRCVDLEKKPEAQPPGPVDPKQS